MDTENEIRKLAEVMFQLSKGLSGIEKELSALRMHVITTSSDPEAVRKKLDLSVEVLSTWNADEEEAFRQGEAVLALFKAGKDTDETDG
jgi:hypothetical protein